MGQHNLTVLLTCHENRECVSDVINNILKFNDDVCILINNGSADSLKDFNGENVRIIDRQVKFERFDTMIPLHLELHHYMVTHDIQSDYVLLMASNQLFVRHGFYDFIKSYDGSYYNRKIDTRCIRRLLKYGVFIDYFNELRKWNFKYQSNHDGMFFKYEIFMKMMLYFQKYTGIRQDNHAEEFLYPAYMIKHNYHLVDFDKYNYWQKNWTNGWPILELEETKKAIENGFFLVKRVSREFNDPSRTYIRDICIPEITRTF